MAQTTELIGADRVKRRLTTCRQRMQNPRPFLETCGGILSRSAATTWNMRGRPAWAARLDNKPHPLMEKSGDLRRSVENTQNTGGSICEILISKSKSVLNFGTRIYYGFYHQITGVGKAKTRRPFLKFYPEDIEEIRLEARHYFFVLGKSDN